MSREYFNHKILELSNEDIVNTEPLREYACKHIYNEHTCCIGKSCKECVSAFLNEDKLETFIIKALGLEDYYRLSTDWLQGCVEFARPFEKELLEFKYMILAIDNYYDAYEDDAEKYLIAKNFDIVIYENVHNVRFNI